MLKVIVALFGQAISENPGVLTYPESLAPKYQEDFRISWVATLTAAWWYRLEYYRAEVASNQPTPLDRCALVPPPIRIPPEVQWDFLLSRAGITKDVDIAPLLQAFGAKLEAYVRSNGPVGINIVFSIEWRDDCLMLC